MKSPTFDQLLRDPISLAAFGFGAGLTPRAPGTAGTVIAIPFALASHLLFGVWFQLAVVMFVAAIGVWICQHASHKLGVHDHPGIVWDEIAGFMLTMVAAPAGWWWWVVGFALFRLFDIWKPWPIGWLDRRVGGGGGIMIDDLVAGIYAFTVLQLLAWGGS